MYEEYEESNGIGSFLASSAGIAGLGTAGTLAERARRRANNMDQGFRESFTQVGKDAAKDINNAWHVVVGETDYDGYLRDANDLENGVINNEAERRRIEAKYDSGASVPGSFRERSQRPDAGAFSTTSGRGAYIPNPLTQAAVAARDAFAPSAEDFLGFRRDDRLRKGQSPEGPKADTVLHRIPLGDAVREFFPSNFGGFDAEERVQRKTAGIDLMRGNSWQSAGSVLGRAASDFVNNGARSVWWLLNAPQAVADVAAEGFTGRANREGLYGLDYKLHDDAVKSGWVAPATEDADVQLKGVTNRVQFDMRNMDTQDPQLAARVKGLLDKKGKPSGILPKNKQVYSRRRVGNNLSTLLALPAAVAINTGLGLNNPFGGEEGRRAVFESEEDPTKTDNVLAEVASKYILGRQGKLLPWDEYKQVRPDVTKDEYRAYKAYQFDKRPDYNIFDDGDLNMLDGVVKYNDDGIDGAELMFLGRSMPVATTLVPTAAAIAGGTLGAALGRHGSLSLSGVEEGIRTGGVEMETLKKELDLLDGDAPERPRKEQRLEKVTRQNEGRIGKQDFMKNGPLKGLFNNPSIRRTGVVRGGVLGGLAAAGISQLIGNEAEKRRRSYEAEQGI